MTAASFELKQIVAAARPLIEASLDVTRRLNLHFLAAWREGRLSASWDQLHAEHPELYLHYFIRARGLGDIKIGKTNHIGTRFRNILVSCSRGADLVACYPAHRAHETELFAEFSASRLCGEWFAIEDDVADYLSLIGSDLGPAPDWPRGMRRRIRDPFDQFARLG